MSATSAFERTIFFATLAQDSALSIGGIDVPGTPEHAFAKIDGRPVLSARGLKGAAVAMARRCFTELPRSISDDALDQALVRSAWRFEHARLLSEPTLPGLALRAGVGILQETGARAEGVLYRREVVPAGTRWQLELHVDWRLASQIGESPEDAEGVLGYVLAAQWAQGRCWLGGGVARGLGWCRLEAPSLRAHRLTKAQYEAWLASARSQLPHAEAELPMREPTRRWFFRTLELTIPFGEHRPREGGPTWGVDMLAIGAHGQDATTQRYDQAHWLPSRQLPTASGVPGKDGMLATNRAIAMELERPLLPGSSLRGPLRHAYSRQLNSTGNGTADPHLLTKLPPDSVVPDAAGALFGTLQHSARLLIRDSRAEEGWLAARLHQHAEDELAGGSFASAKRDAVRLLRGSFQIQLLVEGPVEDEVRAQLEALDRVIALGQLGHLPIGGHKTRGAGWSQWRRGTAQWQAFDVQPRGARAMTRAATESRTRGEREIGSPLAEGHKFANVPSHRGTIVTAEPGTLDIATLTLGEAARRARQVMTGPLSCWWCEPRIDLARQPPLTFGLAAWPDDSDLGVDEVIFFGERESWRAARVRAGWRTFLLRVKDDEQGSATYRAIPASLHLDSRRRFSAAPHKTSAITLHEWSEGTSVLGFTAKGSPS